MAAEVATRRACGVRDSCHAPGRTGEKFSPGTEDEKLPVDGFMNKPARPEELYRRVGMLLDMKISKWARRFSS